jgi:hypothetical protein
MRFFGVILALLVVATPAYASRKPVRAKPYQVHTVPLAGTNGATEIIHERSPLRDEAVFHAEPQLFGPGAVMLFEIFSDAKDGRVERFRCVALYDVAECLGTPVRIRYLPKDERIVLRVTVQHAISDAGAVLVAEAKSKTALPEDATAQRPQGM